MSESSLKTGSNLGRYQIERALGSGAMGDVYLAADPQIERHLAIKTVRLQGTEQQVTERRERLLREARAAGKLIHPHVVTLFDAGEHEGLVYLAFEYVEGEDLDDRMKREPALTLVECLRLGRQVASALASAHLQGIVHRDIKPANILMTVFGDAKVADFGIAKMETQATAMTTTGMVVGSPQYMSPEQVRAEPLDGRSDQFSLGTVLYEALTGRRAFNSETITSLVYQILHHDPADLRQQRPDLPGSVVAIVQRMMSKDREDRFRDMESVERALRALEDAALAGNELSDEVPGGSANSLGARDSTVPVAPPPPAVPTLESTPETRSTAPPPPPSAVPASGAPEPPPVTAAESVPGVPPQSPAATTSGPDTSVRPGRSPIPILIVLSLLVLVALAFVLSRFLGGDSDEQSVAQLGAGSEPSIEVPAASSDTADEETEPAVQDSEATSGSTPSNTRGGSSEVSLGNDGSVQSTVEPVQASEPRPGSSAQPSTSGRPANTPPPPPSQDPAPAAVSTPSTGQSAASAEPPIPASEPAVVEEEPPPSGFPSDIAIDRELATGRTIYLDVKPDNAFIQVRGFYDTRFNQMGRIREYAKSGLELPSTGAYLLRLRAEGRRDWVARLEVTDGEPAARLTLDLPRR